MPAALGKEGEPFYQKHEQALIAKANGKPSAPPPQRYTESKTTTNKPARRAPASAHRSNG